MATEISQAKSEAAKALAARECDTFGEDFLSTPLASSIGETTDIRIHATPLGSSGDHGIEYSGEIFSTVPAPQEGLGFPLVPSEGLKGEELYSRADRE